ncbi:hypothetical protein [Aureivirga sp. CE67]|uniref:hypothetical protein n=1 Tax=Aureivirga sp. CE67 TaxID=1788983 RepID=UPI0018C95898|nr:hypothetical protein [Aureivirga sp. CE67]
MKKIIIVCLIFIACKKDTNQVIVNNDFKKVLVNYIDKNPTNKNHSDKNPFVKFKKPIYHVFFEKVNTDTIIVVKLFPDLVPYTLIPSEISKDTSELVSEIKYSGYFFTNESPVVVFDPNDLSKNIISKKNLKQNLPKDYIWEIGYANVHLRNKAMYYKLSDSKLQKFEFSPTEARINNR